jgi:hypothetical protein
MGSFKKMALGTIVWEEARLKYIRRKGEDGEMG